MKCKWLGWLMLGLLAVAGDRAEACSCLSSPKSCDSTAKGSTVFEGSVIDVAPPLTQRSGQIIQRAWAARKIQFQVNETFRGEEKELREVWTGFGGGDCGFNFEVGKRYVVYVSADGETGRDYTGICSATRVFQGASSATEYLRSQKLGRATNTIYGVATADVQAARMRQSHWSDAPVERPLNGVKVTVTSGAETRVVQTDAFGVFAIDHLADGKYTLSVAGEGYLFSGFDQSVEVKEAGCSLQVILGQRLGAKP